MSDATPTPVTRAPIRGSLLFEQLGWFIRLRWIFAASALLAAVADRFLLNWLEDGGWVLLVGGVILGYNALLWAALRSLRGRSPADRGRPLLLLAWVQILLDLAVLTLLVLLTGKLASPLIGFYVFHMVFASLLLPRQLAYGAGLAAIVLLAASLWLTNSWPAERGGQLVLLGWCLTLVLTIYLANHITRRLRRHRRQLVRQNRRIRAMSRQLRRQQQSLIQHEKMVALGQMAAGVTHEIANPLASMDSLLQLIQRRPEKLKPETVITLREQVERINQIIQQMKTFAHPAETQWQTQPLNDAVERALDMVRFDKRIQRVHIERRYGEDVGAVTLLPQALQQVLVNLVINAVDAMASVPEPQLIIRTSRDERTCAVDVIDNGHGIAPEHVAHLFEPFFTTKPIGKGTGLGLSISYSLVQKMGGGIEVRSIPGVGATFTIRLPLTGPTGDSRPREAVAQAVSASEKPASKSFPGR